MIILDKNDTKILYELNLNSRQPVSKLAKKARLSKQSANYRINKLVQNGFIKQYYTLINFTRLGYKPYKIFLRLDNLEKKEIYQLLEEFRHTDNIVWTVHCDGRYDVILGLIAKNTGHFKDIYYGILEKYQKFILFSGHSTILSAHQSKKDYLSNNKYKSDSINFYVNEEVIKIDNADSKILRILSTDSKTPIIEIAKKLNLTPEAVRIRIKNLERKNIIIGSSILLDVSKIGYFSYKVLINLKNKTKEDLDRMINFLKNHRSILEVISVLGNWDLEIDIDVKSITELNDIMSQIRTRFKELVNDYSALIKYEEHSYNYYPVPE